MSQALATEPVPLQRDDDGTLRVIGTRVPLDTVIRQYEEGATPEEIAEDFSSLELGDIYAIVSYYLRHHDEIREYLEHRRVAAEESRRRFATRTSLA